MTIRSRLLSLLLPTLIAFVLLIAFFFYFNWSHEILDSFKSRLQSIVVASAQSIDPTEVEWISKHLNDPDLRDNSTYQQYRQQLIQLKQKLPIRHLYLVRIEPVKEGESVLSKSQDHSSNKAADNSQDNAYRQVYLLDASESKTEGTTIPGEFDYSENEEQKVYFTKKALVTPIYEARKTGERFMSGYAPIVNAQGEVIALLAADVSVKEIDRKLSNALLVISLGTFLTSLLILGTVYLIADKISKPVQQLNQAALDIAAGNYEADIHVKGPREIVELANTLNTMSECLVENISRLRESSLIRERMYGEYECALLLQYYMFQKVIEEFKDPHIQMRSLSVNLAATQQGILLRYDYPSSTHLRFRLIEAKDPGFVGLYDLNASTYLPLDRMQDHPYIECQFENGYQTLRYQMQHLSPALVWSIKTSQFVRGIDQVIDLQNQDMVFLYNSDLVDQFGSQEKMEAWLSRILRHFAEDGLETIHTMLTNELNFLAKKEHIKRNFHILGLQMKLPQA